MSRPPRRLSNQLALGLFLLLLLSSAAIIGFTVSNAPRFLQELNQGLNRGLAANIVKEKPLLLDHGVNRQALQSVFMGLMLVNPAIEVYLLDREGKLLAYSAPKGVVKAKRIDLAPVKRFLASHGGAPILGDDPREPGRRKVFSAATIHRQGRLQGYLYIVLGGQAYDSVLSMLQSSYMLKLWLVGVVLSTLLALLAGVLTVHHITGRLTRLSTAMQRFRDSDFRQGLQLPWRIQGRGDEIDRLGERFCELSGRIMQQLQALRDDDSLRRELVANISHDLRTPVASLQGYLETLELKAEGLDEAQRRHYIRIAYQHSERLQRLISELFELSTLESRDRALQLERFSLTELAQDVGQKFRLMAEQKGIELALHIPPHPATVRADIGLIQRALDNLIDNAIKYTPRGGRVEVQLAVEGSTISTRISDTGPGIEAAEIPRIFERCYRVDKHRGSEGSGLGLAIAQRILQLHDSCIRVHSRPEQGTSFCFQLQTHQA